MPPAKKIVIVTSGQPSANPRVVKEATALAYANYDVTVIYAPLSPWADKFDQHLFAGQKDVTWVRAGFSAIQQRRKYAFARLRRKLYQVLYTRFSFLGVAAEKAFILYSQELTKAAASIKADLYIAHNLGALPAAARAAKKWNTIFAFDAEDFHRGESDAGSLENNLVSRIENVYFPRAAYITAASPLIADAYKALFPEQQFLTINNVFNRQFLQSLQYHEKEELSLFWFSQTVGTNRGLELVVKALNTLPECNISLYLLGDCKPDFEQSLKGLSHKPGCIHFIPPVPLAEVFSIAARFDIGLATEIPHIVNRDICLTNKLFTYVLAGNCIVASNTSAQQQFLTSYPNIGVLYKHDDVHDLAEKLRELYADRQKLLAYRNNALQLAATTLNWEEESKYLLDIVKCKLSKAAH